MTEFFGQEIQVVAVGLPVGVMLDYAGATAPIDWMKAEGQALNKADYAALFAVLGEAFGTGDGSGAQFNLPDTRNRVLVGASSTRPIGTAGGAEEVALSAAEMPAHSHTGLTDVDGPDHSHPIDIFSVNANWHTGSPPVLIVGTGAAGSQFGANYYPGNTQVATLGLVSNYEHNHRVMGNSGGASVRHKHSVLSDGGGQAHDNMQPFVVVAKIIKVA